MVRLRGRQKPAAGQRLLVSLPSSMTTRTLAAMTRKMPTIPTSKIGRVWAR